MIYQILNALDSAATLPQVHAHCDIPCKIYDPASAQLAALSVVRLMDIMMEASAAETGTLDTQNTIARCVMRKEEEAEKVKQEIRVIWGDYFKTPHFKEYGEIDDLTHQIMQKASACKQGIHRNDGHVLVNLINQFAEIFWHTKEIKTVRRICPYPPSLETVYPYL